MGDWDCGSFGNDTALDFAAELTDFETIRKKLVQFEKQTSALDADDASVALAACDVLAATIGRPPVDLPDIPKFEKDEVTDDLLASAKSIVERVRNNSELSELWGEEDDSEWQDALDGLNTRLDLSKPYKAPRKKKKRKLPDDFLGHCYICFEEVTERNGILFEHTMFEGISCSIHPHRKCIEEAISGSHWKKDGTPTAKTRKYLLKSMGIEE